MLQVDSRLFYEKNLVEQVSKVLEKTKERVTMFQQIHISVETHPLEKSWFISLKTEDNQRDWLEEFLAVGTKDIRAFALLLDDEATAYAVRYACQSFNRKKHPGYPLHIALV